jgi:hypothetical protein
MWGTSRRIAICILVAGCGTGETRVDPADLQLRDLLGVAPEVAARWDAGQRAAARRVLADGLHAQDTPSDVTGASIVDRLIVLDDRRAAADEDALGLVVLDGTHAVPTPTDLADTARTLDLVLDDGWRAQPISPERGMAVLETFGGDAGHEDGPLVVVPAPWLPAIAGYEHGKLLVNPIVIAALEPSAGGAVAEAARVVTTSTTTHPQHPAVGGAQTAANGSIGNPYSFYGSIAECAAAQRSRCEACLPSNDCVPVTNTSDGNAECTTLAASDGRGYFLICINAALAISGVDSCADKKASGCARDTGAAASLSDLEANADFLDDPTCSSGLDSCLNDLYGAPSGSYPGPGPDAGTSSGEPPRSTNINCGDGCSDNNANCQASPNCNCSGPSCGNSLSCDSTCASSNNQNGCGGSCDSCDSSSDGGGGGGGGGGCGGDSSSSSSSGGGGCNSGCSSSSSSSSSGGSSGCSSCNDSSSSSSSGGSSGCGSCNDSSSSSSSGGSSGCGGGDCGGSSSSSSSGDSCGGGGGGGKCSVVRGEPNAAFALLLSIMWGVLPVPFAARARKRAKARKAKEVQP